MIRKPTTRIPQFRRLCKEITIAQKSQFLEMRFGQSKPFISESTQFRNVKHLVAISIRGCNVLSARDWLGFKFVFVFVFVCTCIRICIVLCVQQKQWEIPACPRPVCPLDFEHGWADHPRHHENQEQQLQHLHQHQLFTSCMCVELLLSVLEGAEWTNKKFVVVYM